MLLHMEITTYGSYYSFFSMSCNSLVVAVLCNLMFIWEAFLNLEFMIYEL